MLILNLFCDTQQRIKHPVDNAAVIEPNIRVQQHARLQRNLLVVGFDRLGISPKVSFLVSSLFFAAFFGGLAIIGGIKRNVTAEVFEANFKT